MATNKNITMKQFNGTDYDTLYPATIAEQIPDVYSTSETYSQTQTNNLLAQKAPAYTYGTEDLTAGVSALETGKLYFVYE